MKGKGREEIKTVGRKRKIKQNKVKKKKCIDEDLNNKSAHSTTTLRNTSRQTHVIVSYLKVIFNLQAGSRDKAIFVRGGSHYRNVRL